MKKCLNLYSMLEIFLDYSIYFCCCRSIFFSSTRSAPPYSVFPAVALLKEDQHKNSLTTKTERTNSEKNNPAQSCFCFFPQLFEVLLSLCMVVSCFVYKRTANVVLFKMHEDETRKYTHRKEKRISIKLLFCNYSCIFYFYL
jgi:hypothetical protein